MKKKFFSRTIITLLSLFVFGLITTAVYADGLEELGAPSIPIVPGTGIVAAGTGLHNVASGDISIDVPAGATVEQVLLYWQGLDVYPLAPDPGDETAVIEGIEVTGIPISVSPIIFETEDSAVFAYRADITGLGLVNPGSNVLTVSGVSFGIRTDGAGILVVFDDPSFPTANIDIRDGLDAAWLTTPEEEAERQTAPQIFNFAPSPFDRAAQLSMFFASVSGTGSTGGFRPTAIEITIGGTTTVLDNLLDSNDGEEWDTLNLLVDIPAGETSMTVQALSVDNDPPTEGPEGQPEGPAASFTWITAGLSVLPPFCGDENVDLDEGETCDPPGSNQGQPNECRDDCTFCGDGNLDAGEQCDDGNNIDGDGCSAFCTEEGICGTGTPGYWKNHPEAWPNDSIWVDGLEYTKAEAIFLMGKDGEGQKGNKCLTMYRSIVAAKLNILNGCAGSCVLGTIASADEWMDIHCVDPSIPMCLDKNETGCLKVDGDSDAWKIGEPLYEFLDRYNNGLECDPSRDYTNDPHDICIPSGWPYDGGGDPPGGATCSEYTTKEACNADASCSWKKKIGTCAGADSGSGGSGKPPKEK
jgi:cysteine-rich repeat protein